MLYIRIDVLLEKYIKSIVIKLLDTVKIVFVFRFL